MAVSVKVGGETRRLYTGQISADAVDHWLEYCYALVRLHGLVQDQSAQAEGRGADEILFHGTTFKGHKNSRIHAVVQN